MAEELKACPFCHREAQQTLCSGLVSCAYEDCPAFLLAVFPEHWNTRAQLPSQGGEAVEVVAWQDAENPLHTTAERRVMHDWAGNGYPIVELMTVAQHQRILAATTRPAGQVSENVNALSATALRRAARFLESIDNGCNEVKTLRSLMANSELVKK